MPTAVIPCAVGGRNPQRRSNRAACSSPTGNPRAYSFGVAPISEPPWTPLCPRIGMSPHFGRPTIPPARPRFTIARTLSTPKRWCVIPMLHTKTAVSARTYMSAKSNIASRRRHDRDLRALLLRVIQVLRRHRLIVRHIGTEEHDEVAADPIRVGTGRGGDPDGLLEARRARGMTGPARVVDMVRAEEPRRFARDVVRFVRHAAGGHEEGEPIRRSHPYPSGRDAECFVT